MKSLKYWLSFLSLILLIAVPCGGIQYLSTQPGFDITEFAMEYPMQICIAVVVWLALFKSCNRWYEKSKYNKNVDAFGMTSKFGYFDLSDKERKEYDKQRKEEMNRVMPESTIRKATHPGSKKPEQEMAALSGMDEVKEKITEIVARAKHMAKKVKGSVHIMFFTVHQEQVKLHLQEYLQDFCTKTKSLQKTSALKLMETFSRHLPLEKEV